MTTVTYEVPNISCGHCVHTIQMELSEVEGVSRVEASESEKRVQIEFEPPADEDQLVALLKDINYPPTT